MCLCVRGQSLAWLLPSSDWSQPSQAPNDRRLIEMPFARRPLFATVPTHSLCLLRMLNLANSQLNRKVKMSLIASIYLNEFSLAECRACYKFLVLLPFIACPSPLLSPPRLPDPSTNARSDTPIPSYTFYQDNIHPQATRPICS